jgi:hypothetical protein
MPKFTNLEPQAYKSLLKHAELCNTDLDYDWDHVTKDRRHAMNAVLDLEAANKRIAELEAAGIDAVEREKSVRGMYEAEYGRVKKLEQEVANKRITMLTSALERTLSNFEYLLAQKPVRDAAETIAEAQAALRG